MTTDSSLFHSDPEDIFAKAIDRVEAGEPIEVVLADAPEAMRPELRELLLLITATHHLQRAPVPQTPAPRRAERKAAFLQAAAQIKPETAPVHTLVAPPVTTKRAAVARPAQSISPLEKWLRNFWRDFQIGFTSPNLRLAPLLMIIAAVWAGAFGFFKAADAAELGDLAYPVKQWIGYQELALSPAAARSEVYELEIERRLQEDVLKAQEKLGANEEATGQKKAITTTESLLIFKGVERGDPKTEEDDYLLIGPLRVMTKYQPDPNDDQRFEAMQWPGVPEPGSQVALTFQTISIGDDSSGPPLVVQGIEMTLVDGQLAFTNDANPLVLTVSAPTPGACAALPNGWVPYRVLTGDTLSELASRTGTTVAQLKAVNCHLKADLIVASSTILVPGIEPTDTPPPAEPTLEAILTAISTTVLTPSIDITATVTVVPTDTNAISPTATLTVAATAEATTTVTATVDLTPAPTLTETTTVEATDPVTPTTVIVTMTLTAAPTLAPMETVTATGVPAPGTPVAPTVTAAETPEAPEVGTATVSATPGATEDAGTPLTPSPTPSAEVKREQTPTPIDSPTPTRETSAGGSSSGGGETAPTATDTPISQSYSPLSGR